VRWLCLEASAIDDVDYTAAETLRALFHDLREKGVTLVIAQVMEDVRNENRYRLREQFGADVWYDTLDEMMAAYRARFPDS
jgi:MFS superfamily sulfate permease-like transporter